MDRLFCYWWLWGNILDTTGMCTIILDGPSWVTPYGLSQAKFYSGLCVWALVVLPGGLEVSDTRPVVPGPSPFRFRVVDSGRVSKEAGAGQATKVSDHLIGGWRQGE